MTPIVNAFFSTGLSFSAYGDDRVRDVAKENKKRSQDVAFEVSRYVLNQFALSEAGPFSEGSNLNETYLIVKDLYLSVVSKLLNKESLQTDEHVRRYLQNYSAYTDEVKILERLKKEAISAHDELQTFPNIYEIPGLQAIDPFAEEMEERRLNKYIVLFDSENRPIHLEDLDPKTQEEAYRRTMARLEEILEMVIPDWMKDRLKEIYISENRRRELVYFLACPTLVQRDEPYTLKIFRKVYGLKSEVRQENRQAVCKWLLHEINNLPRDWNEFEFREEDIETVLQLQTVLPEEIDPRGISFYSYLRQYKNIDALLEISKSPYFEPDFESIHEFLKAKIYPIEKFIECFEEHGIRGTSPEFLQLAQMDAGLYLPTFKMLIEEWKVELNVLEAVRILRNLARCKGCGKIRGYIEDYPSEVKKGVYSGLLPLEIFGNWEHAKGVLEKYRKRYSLEDVAFIRLCLFYIATDMAPLSVVVLIEKFTEKEIPKEGFLSIMQASFDATETVTLLKKLSPQDRREDQESVLAEIPRLLFLEDPNSLLIEAIIPPLQERIEKINPQPVS